MFSQEKTRTLFSRWVGVSLGALLVAHGVNLGPSHSSPAQAVGIALAAPAPDGACQALLDASDKPITTPYHLYSADTDPDGKTTTHEGIYVGGAMYSLVKGKWFRFPVSPDDMKGMMQGGRKNLKGASCHVVRNEMVNGELATVYSVHSENEFGIHDGQVWLSPSKGLLLREEGDTQRPGESRKRHMSIRLDYNNVQPPAQYETLQMPKP